MWWRRLAGGGGGIGRREVEDEVVVVVVRLRGGGEQRDKTRVERDVVGSNRGRGGGEGVVDGRWVVCVVCNRGGSAWWCRLVRPFALTATT